MSAYLRSSVRRRPHRVIRCTYVGYSKKMGIEIKHVHKSQHFKNERNDLKCVISNEEDKENHSASRKSRAFSVRYIDIL